MQRDKPKHGHEIVYTTTLVTTPPPLTTTTTMMTTIGARGKARYMLAVWAVTPVGVGCCKRKRRAVL